MTKLNEFIEYLNKETENKSLYAWGGQGEAATRKLLNGGKAKKPTGNG